MPFPGTALLRLFALCLSLALPAIATAQDVDGSADHPLIPRYAETEIRNYAISEFDEFRLITGKSNADGSFESTQTLEGSTTHLLYRAPRDRSVLEVFRNYETTFQAAGFETLYTCSKADCGPASMPPSTRARAIAG